MDVLRLTKSKTREKILRLFINNPDKSYYLREIAKKLEKSVGNIKRELVSLRDINLFASRKLGRLVYYKINVDSPIFQITKTLLNQKYMEDIEKKALFWVRSQNPFAPDQESYCQTRDVFSARLETVISKLESALKEDAYLLTAVLGEIGNNSFDHNLGNWPDIPGIFFACDFTSKKIILGDRGQGILKTIQNVYPKAITHKDALNIAFTKRISGRFPEKRGNGLKFVSNAVKEKDWHLKFLTGNAKLILNIGKMTISSCSNIHGCLAVIKYL